MDRHGELVLYPLTLRNSIRILIVELEYVLSLCKQCHNVFLRFLRFFILSTFLFKKFTENSIKNLEKHFLYQRSKLVRQEQLCTHYVHITLDSAYSDTAAVTSCSRQ